MAVSALRLLQYFQFPDKNSRDISRYTYNFYGISSTYVFIPPFLAETLKVFCGNVRLHGALFNKQWNRAQFRKVTACAKLQSGSNMTGTNCDLFTHKSSRSYLNHLVHGAFVVFLFPPRFFSFLSHKVYLNSCCDLLG
jgi:hypothetical protein